MIWLLDGSVLVAMSLNGHIHHRRVHVVKESAMVSLSVPDHKGVAKGTLRSLIR